MDFLLCVDNLIKAHYLSQYRRFVVRVDFQFLSFLFRGFFKKTSRLSVGLRAGVVFLLFFSASVFAISAPSNFVIDVNSGAATSLDLSWTNPDGVQSLVICRAIGTTPPSDPASGVIASSLTGTTYSDVGLTSGTTYAYSIFAKDNADSYSVAATSVVYVGANPAGYTAAVDATDLDQINLAWTPSTEVVLSRNVLVRKIGSFPIKPVDGVYIVTNKGVDAYEDVSLVDATYYYALFSLVDYKDGDTRVIAYSPRLRVSAGGAIGSSITVDTVPGAVTFLRGTVTNGDDVELTWTTPEDLDIATTIIRRSSSGYPTTYSSGDPVSYSGSLPTVTDLNVPDGTYYYSVFLNDNTDHYSSVSTAIVKIQNAVPNAPTGFTATSTPGSFDVNLSWIASTSLDFSSVTILRKAGSVAPVWADRYDSSVTIVAENMTTGTTFSETLADGTYSYSIFAIDVAGNVSVLGSGSKKEALVVNGPPSPVTLNTAYVENGNSIKMAWTNPTNSDFTTGGSIKIYRSTSQFITVPNDSYLVSTLGNTVVSYTDSSLAYGVYYYTIFTFDSDGYYSSPVQVKLEVMPSFTSSVAFAGLSDVVMAVNDVSRNVYVTNGTGKTIRKYDERGVLLQTFTGSSLSANKLSYTGGIVVNSNSGNFYVIDRNNYRVQQFDQNGNFIRKFGSTGSTLGKFSAYPVDIGLDGDGNVYVLDKSGKITKFSATGTALSAVSGLGVVEGLSVSGNVIYLAQGSKNTVSKYSTSFSLLGELGDVDLDGNGLGLLSNPIDVTQDPSGNVFVIQQNNKINVFSPSGNFLAEMDGPSGGTSTPVGIFSDRMGRFFTVDNRVLQHVSVGKLSITDDVLRYTNQASLATTFVAPAANFGAMVIRKSSTSYPVNPWDGTLEVSGQTDLSYSLNLDFGTTPEGLYYYSAFAKADAPESSYSLPVTFNVFVDRTAPNIPIWGSTYSEIKTNIVELGWTNPIDKNSGSGFASVTILRKPGYLDSSTWGTDSEAVTVTANLEELQVGHENSIPDGTYTYAIYAKDLAGNSSAYAYKVVKVDTTVPSLGSLELTNILGTRLVGVSWATLTDSGVGLDTITILRRNDRTPVWSDFSDSGTSVVTENLDISDGSGVLDISSGHEKNLEDGAYYYALFAKDKLGNFDKVGMADVVVNGTPSPVTDLVAGHVAGSRNVTLSWALPEVNTDVSQIIFVRKKDSYASGIDDSEAYVTYLASDVTTTRDILTEDGTYYYSIYLKDTADHLSETAAQTSLVVDSTSPLSPLNLVLTRATGSKQVTLTWNNRSDVDPGSGLSQLAIVRVRDGYLSTTVTFNILNGIALQANQSVTTTDTRVTEDATYSYAIYAKDLRGNISTALVGSIVVDTTPPLSPQDFSATTVLGSGFRNVYLSWQFDSDIASVTIRRSKSEAPIPNLITDGDSVVSDLTSAVTYEDASLSMDGVYRYTIFAKDSYGNMSSSNVSVTVDVTAPSFPTSFEALNTAGTRTVSLSWTNPLSDFGTVVVRRNSGSTPPSTHSSGTLVYSGTGTSVSQTDLADGTYSYSIFANDGYDNYSDKASDTITVDGAPGYPTGFKLSSISGSNIALNWTNPSDADFDSITVLRKAGSTAPLWNEKGTVGVTTVVENETGESLSDSVADGTYSYSIFALDGAGYVSDVQSVTEIAVDTTPPSSPTGFSLTRSIGSKVVALSWDSLDSDVSKLTLVRKENSYPTSITDGEVIELLDNTLRSFSDTGILDDGHYYYNFYVQDVSGNIASPVQVNEDVDTTPPSVPGTFTATRTTGRDVLLAWSSLDSTVAKVVLLRKKDDPLSSISDKGAIKYELFDNTLIATMDTRVTSDAVYYYALYTYDSAGNLSTTFASDDVVVDTGAPSSPTGLTASYALGTRLIELDWENPTNKDFTKITILRKAGTTAALWSERNDSSVTIVTNNLNITSKTPTISSGHETVSTDDYYSYSIFALDDENNVSDLGITAQTSVLVDTVAPDAVSVYSINGNNGSKAVTVKWTNPTDTYFGHTTILRKTGSGAVSESDASATIITRNYGVSAGVNSFIDIVPSDEKYYYTFIVYDSVGNQSTALIPSFRVDTVAPNAPSSVKATSVAASKNVVLSWTNPSDIDPGSGYKAISIRRSDSGYPTSVSAGDLVTSNYVVGVAGDRVTINNVVSTDKTYYYSFFALDATGNVSSRSTAKVVVDSVAPNKPASVSGSSSGRTVSLTWINPIDLSPGSGFSYTMVRRATGNIAPATITTGNFVASSSVLQRAIESGLKDGTHFYTIFAFDAKGNISSQSVSVRVNGSPSTPNNVTAVPSGNSVTLGWVNPTDSDYASLTIRRLGGSAAPSTITSGQLVGSVIPSASLTTSYVDSGLSDAVYSYRLFAKDTSGNISSSSVTVKVNAAPSAPSITSATQTAAMLRKVGLTWTNPSHTDLASLVLVRTDTTYASTVYDRSNNAVSFNIASSYASPLTSTTDTRIAVDGTYYYSLYAVDTSGNISVAGQKQVEVDATGPGAPVFSSAVVSSKTISLSWIGPSEADTSYVKLVRGSGSYPSTPTSGIAVTTLSDTLSGATSGSFTDTVTTEAAYYYSLFAYDSVGNFGLAGQIRATVDVTSPPAATGFSVTNGSGKAVVLAWTNPVDNLSGVSSVSIRRSTSSYPLTSSSGDLVTDNRLALDNSSDSFSETLSGDGTYYYSLFVKDKSGNEGLKATAVVTVDTDRPGVPTSFIASSTGRAVTLSWVKPTDLDFSSVSIRRNSGSAAPTTITSGTGVVTDNSGLTFTDSNLSDGTYSYSIFAKDLSAQISDAASVMVVVNDVPSSPIGLSAAVVSTKTVSLSWTTPANSDFASVTVLRKTSGFSTTILDGDIVTENYLGGVSSVQTTENSVRYDGTYYYSVFAKDTSGNVSSIPATASIRVESGGVNAATSFVATKGSGKLVTLSWVKPIDYDLESLTVRRAVNSEPSSVTRNTLISSGLTGLSTSDTPTADGKYFYSLFAIDTSGNVSALVSTSVQIESGAPSSPQVFSATAVTRNVTLSWVNAYDYDLASVTIRRKTTTYPTSITDGDAVVTNLASSTAGASGSTVNVVSVDGVYYYSIFAKDASGNVSTKATAAVNVDFTVPSKPTGFSATASGKKVYLSWTPPVVSDLNSVKVIRRSDRFPTTISDGYLVVSSIYSTTKIDTVTSDATYYYSAFAVDNVGNYGSPATKSVLVDTVAPGAVTSLNAQQAVSINKTVRLTWTKPSDLDFVSVTIRRSTTSYPSLSTVGTLVSTNAQGTSVTDNLTSDGTYYYSVFSSDTAGNVGVKATANIRVESGAPASVSGFVISSLLKRVELNWSNPVDLDFSSVLILRSTENYVTDNADSDATVVSASVLSTNFFDDVDTDALYYYTLFSKDVSGNIASGVTQSILVDSVAPLAPTSVVATRSVGSKTVTLTWVNSADVSPGSGFDSVTVLQKTGSYSVDSDDGTVVSENMVGTTLSVTVSSDNTYYYSIFPKDIRGNIGSAGQVRVTVDTTAPSIPSLNLSVPLGSRTINVTWVNPSDPSPGTGFAYVTIRRKTGSYPTSVSDGTGVVTQNTSTATSDNVSSDNTYYYSIFGYDNAGNISKAGTANLIVDTVAPPEPSSFESTQNARVVTLSWVNPTDVSPGSGFSSVSVRRSSVSYPADITSGEGVVTGSTLTSVGDTLSSDGTYYYAIFAKDVKGNVGEAATLSVLIDTVAPSAPSSFTAVSSGDQISLTWVNPVDPTPGVGFDGVTIRRGSSSYPSSITTGSAVISGTSAESYTNTSLEDGTYFYSIFAFDLLGNVSLKATASATVETGPPSRPTSLSATASGDSIQLIWTNPSNLDFHSVTLRRSTSGYPSTRNAGTAIFTDSAIQSYSDTPTSDGTYYYSLFARDITGNYTVLPTTVNVVLDYRYPGQPTSVSVSNVAGTSTVNLSWVNPSDLDFKSVFIRRNVGSFVSTSSVGYLVTQNVSALSYADVPTSDGTYYYSLFAKDSNGKISQKAGTASITVETGAPGTISGLSISTTANVIRLTWVKPTDHDYHSVMIRRSHLSMPLTVTQGALVSENVVGTTYSNIPTSDGTYYYAFFTRDITGNVNTTPVTGSILLESGAPAAPSSIVAVVSGSDVDLSWTNPGDLDFSTVSIRRRTDRFPVSIDEVYAIADSLTGSSFSNFDLVDGRYYYSLFAKDIHGNVSERASVTVDVDTVAPLSVTQLQGIVSGNTIVLTWTKSASSDFNSVLIRRNFDSPVLAVTNGTLVTSDLKATRNVFVIPGDGSYYFSVFAKDNAGNYATPATVNVLVDTVSPGQVSGLTISTPNTQINLSWVNPTDSDLSYISVRRSLTDYPTLITEGIQVGTSSKTQSRSETPTRDGVYYYSVFAVDVVGNVGRLVTGNVTFNIFAPASPAGVTLSVVGSAVNISWDAYTDFDFSHVRVIRMDEDLKRATFNVTSSNFVDKSVSDGNYIYYLYGLDTLGYISNAITVAVTIDTVHPSSPTLFSATSNGRVVTISWVKPIDLDFDYVTLTRTTDPSDLDEFDRETVVDNYSGTPNIQDEGLSDGVYYYKLMAYDRTHNASTPVTVSVLVDANPPGSPSGFTATLNGSVVRLSWVNPTTYDFSAILIRRTTDGFVANPIEGTLVTDNVSITSLNNTVDSGYTYYYTIFAKDGMKNYSEPVYASVTYPSPDVTPPNPPKSFRSTVSESTVRLSWTIPTANDFHSIRICRGDTTYPTLNVGMITENVKASQFRDLGLENATYYYSIFARDNTGNYSRAATLNVTVFVRDSTAPAKPTSFNATVTKNVISLSWTNPTDLDLTSLVLRTSTVRFPATAQSETLVTQNTLVTSLIHSNRVEGKHYYSLFALDKSGNYSRAATLSIVVDTTAPSKISNVVRSIVKNNLSVSWTNPTDSDFAKVYVVRSSLGYPSSVTKGTLVKSVGTTLNAFTDLGLADGTYYYGVFTEDLRGNIGKPATFNVFSDTQAPNRIRSFAVTASKNYTCVMTWLIPTDDAVQIVVRDSMSGFPTSYNVGTEVSSLNVTNTRLVLSNLLVGKHFYGIFVRDANYNYSVVSTASVEVTITEDEFKDGIRVDGADIEITSDSTSVIENPVIGSSYSAKVTVNATLSTNGLVIGANSGSSGTAIFANPNAQLNEEGSLIVGNLGTGIVVQSNGRVEVLGALVLGKEIGASGNYVLSGGSLFATSLVIGQSGTGKVTWTGGTLETTSIVGHLVNKGGTLVVDSDTPLTIVGGYSQDDNSTIRLTLNSQNSALSRGKNNFESAASLIEVDGSFVLNGSIDVSLDGYSPRIGDTIRLLNQSVGFQGRVLFNQGMTSRLVNQGAGLVELNLPDLPENQRWDTSEFEMNGIIRILGSATKLVESTPLNYPNPFKMSSGTQIGYFLNQAADIELRVYLKNGVEVYRDHFASGLEGGKIGQNYVAFSSSVVNQEYSAGAYFYVLMHDGKVVARGRFGVLPE